MLTEVRLSCVIKYCPPFQDASSTEIVRLHRHQNLLAHAKTLSYYKPPF